MPQPSTPIRINLNFGADPHSRPSVSNPTNQANTIPATQSSLIWQVTPNEDGVAITGVTFYLSQADKDNKNAYTPPFLTMPGGHSGTDVTTWKIDFSGGVDEQTTLYYDVQYEDDDFDDLDWDPQLTIEPR